MIVQPVFEMALLSARIPRLSLIRYSLYDGVVEKYPPPTTHRGEVRKDGAEIPRGWSLPECFTSLSPFIWNNLVETAAEFNVVRHPRCCVPRNLRGSKLWPLAASAGCLTNRPRSSLVFEMKTKLVYVLKISARRPRQRSHFHDVIIKTGLVRMKTVINKQPQIGFMWG